MSEPDGLPSESFGDDEPVRPPLPPDDRLWRHPSEAGLGQGQPAPAQPRRGEDPPTATRKHSRLPPALAGAVGAVVGAVALALAAPHLLVSPPASNGPIALRAATTPSTASTIASSTDATAAVSPHLVQAASAVRPAIVAVEAASVGWARHGAGLVVGANGMVLTAASLLSGASQVMVTLPSGRRLRARVVGTDGLLGLALLDVHATGLPYATLDSDDHLVVGQLTALVDAPAGRGAPQVAVGEIAALDQPVSVAGRPLSDVMETSTPLMAGAVGSVLLDGRGDVVGIVLASMTANAGKVSVAVPAALASSELALLEKVGHPVSGWLGITVTSRLTSEPASRSGTRSPSSAGSARAGVQVLSVVPGSPAASAGVRPGQVIVGVDGRPVGSFLDLERTIKALPPGAMVDLTIGDAGGTRSLEVRLAAAPGAG